MQASIIIENIYSEIKKLENESHTLMKILCTSKI